MLTKEAIEARIELRIAELRVLAAWTALEAKRFVHPPEPPPQPSVKQR
jgi:hypothetical protein